MNLKLELSQFFSADWMRRLQQISKVAADFGLHPYLVGGSVRDILLSRPYNQDCDVSFTGGNLEPLVRHLFQLMQADLSSKELKQYKSFGTFTLFFKDGSHLDLITARKEIYPYPGALPQVQPGTLDDDILRRDFSVNALFIDLSQQSWGNLIDDCGGFDDLKNGTLRVIHAKSFEDDPTRLFRLARYTGRLHFKVDPQTENWAQQAIQEGALQTISGHRISTELEKILVETQAAPILSLLVSWRILSSLNVSTNLNAPTNWKNCFDKVDHPVLENNLRQRVVVRLVLMLQNVPESEKFLSKIHWNLGEAKKVEQILSIAKALVASEPIVTLKQQNLFPETRLFFQVIAPALQSRWQEYVRWMETTPILTGEDLQSLGYSPSPKYKIILEKLAMKKFEGQLKTKAAEIQFIVDNFSRD